MSGATVAAIASALIALMALLFSVVSFNRQQTRAAPQQETAEVLAKASVKPLLWIHPQRYLDRKALFLRNYGLGPAIIRSAEVGKPVLDVYVKGDADSRATALSAGVSPPRVRTAGWMPRDNSRSSCTAVA
jgi:hypothetical protein